ncbi:carbohydrate kinase, FGGY family protein [delta proteobacterium NaphS2]|nr:carbohydrate kinase, FGGY family protein [delta proteobacterium NaphS2]
MSNTSEKRNRLLVFDVGTQSIRGAVIDPEGNFRKLIKTPIDPYVSPQPGWAEQDPAYYWRNLVITAQKLLGSNEIKLDHIAGMSLTCQRTTMVNLDKNGKPLRPAILWLDQRKAEDSHRISRWIRWGLKTIGRFELIEKAVRESKSNWIQDHEPEIWDKTDKFLFLSGFLTHRLTGEYRDSCGNMVGYLPFNFKRQTWCNPRNMRWKLFPMERYLLPQLVKPGTILGHVTSGASRETGIPEGLPVIAAGTDKACEVLGAACLSPDVACISYGTTATINTANGKYVQIRPFAPAYPSAVPDAYNTEVMVYRGFWLVSWFKEQFGGREMELAGKRNVAPEALFDELIENIPPGSMGLTLQPYWSPGMNTDADAKGAIIGFGDVHTRAHIYRSILEGLGYALKDGMLALEKKNRVKIECLRVSGGGSQSNMAMQITADIFNRPVQRPHTYETTALGAAVDAAVGLGFYSDFPTAVRNMTRITDVFEPIPENRDLYEELFERVYLKMYKRLRPIYNEIRAITGYPAS